MAFSLDMDLASVIALALLMGIVYFAFKFCQPPPSFPKNIPTIPIYVAFVPLFTNLGQDEIYECYLRKPLERYGAVKIFFGSRWNILVQRPSFLQEVFKDSEIIYEKSGNQKKIPYSVLAHLTGDNIISAHGENWKLYREIMTPSFKASELVHCVDRITSLAASFVSLCLEEQGRLGWGQGVAVNSLLQRFAIDCVGHGFLATDFKALSNQSIPIHLIHSKIKAEIFRPFFLTFPILDLILPSRKALHQTVAEFEHTLARAAGNGLPISNHEDTAENLIFRMCQAKRAGKWTEKQFLDNLKIIFIAGHENVQQLSNSLLYILGKHQEAQAKLRQEVLEYHSKLNNHDESGAKADPGFHHHLKDLPYLNAVLYETLRLYPPIPQLFNRKTTTDTLLGADIYIPANTYIGWTAFGAHRCPISWRDDPNEFRPERWGDDSATIYSNYRKYTSKAQFIAFHGGRRACLGREFALMEARTMLAELVMRAGWRLDEEWEVDGKMTPGGLLAPRGLKVVFTEM